ncbi:hypothetical protein [Geodermatophilus sp. CPCC 205506]|uniref:hypothetical protein n=1 Tax=Geodermatophilus sp. CPCC 205506 TaxID=2936596 RepID=UPI003EECED37
MRTTTRPFRCSFCGRESAPALTTLCAGCLSTAAELVRGVLVEDGLSIDVGRLMDAGQPGDEETSSRVQLLWSLAARLAAAEQQIDAATDALMDHGYMDGDQDLRQAVEDAVAEAAECKAVSDVLLKAELLLDDQGLGEAVKDAVAMAAEADTAIEVLAGAGFMPGAQDLSEAVSDAIANATEVEAARGVLLHHGYMDEGQDLREALEAAVAAAAEAGGAREVLTDVGYMSGGRSLVEAVCDVITENVDRGQRYFRERQYRVNVAAVASRVILRTHSESHAGSVATCATCAVDWAVVEEASGVRAPGN